MTYDPTKSLGERIQDALFAGFGTMPVPSTYRVMPFADLPAEHQASWNRAAVNFVARLSDAPQGGAEIRNALRLALAFAEQEAEQRSEAGGSMTDYITEAEEVVDTVRSALKVAENLP